MKHNWKNGHPMSRKVINLDTGEIFPTVKAASKSVGARFAQPLLQSLKKNRTYKKRDLLIMTNCTYIDGIGSSQVIDSSGEIVDIAGLDCSSLIGGAFNYEHQNIAPNQLIGKVLDYKKIFSEKDCDNDRHKHFWKKVKAPFLYVMGRLFDDKKESSKEVAALIKDDAEHPNEKPMLSFSIEGNKLPGAKEGMTITHSIARKVTLTNLPANKTCVAELMPKKSDKSKKDDFDSLFKGEVEFFAPEPSYLEFLEKKEQTLEKSAPVAAAPAPKAPIVPQGWKAFKSNHPLVGDVVGFKHGQHGAVTVHKDSESGKYHVNHRGAQAGVMGQKGVFDKPKEALAHAAKYVNAYHQGKVLGRASHGDPMAKSLEVGSGMGAPSTLTQGAALAKEDLMNKPVFASVTGKQAAASQGLRTGAGTSYMGAHVRRGTPHNTERAKQIATKELSKLKSAKKPKLTKSEKLIRAEQAYDTWGKKEEFEKFMSNSWPHFTKGEIKAFGHAIMLGKSLDAESSLAKMMGSFYEKSEDVPSSENECNEK